MPTFTSFRIASHHAKKRAKKEPLLERNNLSELTKDEKLTMALAEEVFGFYIPTVSLMGVGCAKETGTQAKALGATNMLIVTDAGLNKLGVAAQIKAMIESAG